MGRIQILDRRFEVLARRSCHVSGLGRGAVLRLGRGCLVLLGPQSLQPTLTDGVKDRTVASFTSRERAPGFLNSPRSINCRPGLLTGTSTEYLGRRPTPRVIRQRSIAVVIGPDGVGKTTVARRLARLNLDADVQPAYLDTLGLQKALLDRVRMGRWDPMLLSAPALVLDGPVWLRNRQGVVSMLVELLNERAQLSRRTLVCQSDRDGSIQELIGALETGSLVVIGLRFPKGRRGRMRFAKRLCEELGVPVDAARGTCAVYPWRYDRVIAQLRAWPAVGSTPEPSDACTEKPA